MGRRFQLSVAHGAVRAILADGGGRFAIAQVAGEKAVRDDGRALRGNAFVVVGERAEAGAVREPGVGDHVDDVGAVLQLSQLIHGEKTHAREIRFHAEDAVELDGMADGFVNLQPELRAAQNNRALAFGALRGGVQRDGLLGDASAHCRPDRAIRPAHSLATCAGRRNYSDRSASGFPSRQSSWRQFPRLIAFLLDESRSRCWKRKAARFGGRTSSLPRPLRP